MQHDASIGQTVTPLQAFWNAANRDVFDASAVRTLCQRAMEGDQESVEALFGEIVEPLSDAFTERAARLYVRTFAEAIDVARAAPDGARLDRELTAFGLADTESLVARGTRLLAACAPPPIGQANLFVVLSRVTLGADVALVTPMLNALLERDPAARAIFLAPEASRGIVAGHPRVAFRAVSYARRGSLVDRLNAWLPILELVRAETGGEDTGRYLVIDPDSRLTQLGLFPLASDARTRVFASRTDHAPDLPRLGQLAARWAHALTGVPHPPRARLWLSEDALAWAERLRVLLAPPGRSLASVHFGVGGNERKRLGERFELALLRGLARRGMTVLLARGVTEAEIQQTARLTAALRQDGLAVLDLPAGRDLGPLALAESPPTVVTWQADSGAFCASVAASDLYVGYDSAGQHVAAAANVPAVALFVVSAGPRHLERWSPHGPRARVHAVLPGADQEPAAADVLRLADALRAEGSPNRVS